MNGLFGLVNSRVTHLGVLQRLFLEELEVGLKSTKQLRHIYTSSAHATTAMTSYELYVYLVIYIIIIIFMTLTTPSQAMTFQVWGDEVQASPRR